MQSPDKLRHEKTLITKGFSAPELPLTREKTLTLGEVIQTTEPDPLGLLSAPAKLQVFDNDFFTIHSIQFPTLHLSGVELRKLLTQARPHDSLLFKRHLRRNDIMGDWIIFEENDPLAMSLMQDHAKDLEPYWSEFGQQHVKQFSDALTAYPTDVTEHLLSNVIQRFVSKDYAIQHLPDLLYKQEQDTLERNKSADKFHQRPLSHRMTIFHEWNAIKDAVCKNPSLNEIFSQLDKNDLYKTLYYAEPEIIRDILETCTLEMRKKLIENDILFGGYYVVNTHGDPKKFSMWTDDAESAQEALLLPSYLGENKAFAQVQYSDSSVTVSLENGYPEKIGRVISDDTDKHISPWMVWVDVKKTGQSFYLTSKLPSWLTSKVSNDANPLLGLIMATALSPEVRDKLSDQLRLSAKPGVDQQNQEAQIPMVISQKRGFILGRSRLFSKLTN